ncbi:MAG: hypothetical protein N3F08_03080, partial [Crenarchaeota archaeon]|nr:hypothetical protein [Thermoproteota archaeon]
AELGAALQEHDGLLKVKTQREDSAESTGEAESSDRAEGWLSRCRIIYAAMIRRKRAFRAI